MESVLYSQQNETILHIPSDIGKYETDLILFISSSLRSRSHATVTLYNLLRAVSNKDHRL